MRSFGVVAIVILALMPAAVLAAWPSFSLHTSPPGHFGIRDLWSVSANSDSTRSGFWIEAFVDEASDGQVFYAKTDTFTLYPGRRLFWYDSMKIVETSVAPGFEALLAGTGQLPVGEYMFRIALQPEPGFMQARIEPDSAAPPRLVSPADSEIVDTLNPQFKWTPPAALRKARVTYELKLVELRPDQTSEQALAANRPVLIRRGLDTTTFSYPPSAPALVPGAGYVWRVVATAKGGPTMPSTTGEFFLDWGRTPERHAEAREDELKKLGELLPGAWRTISKAGIKLSGAECRYIPDSAWQALVAQWQGLVRERPGRLTTPAPDNWPGVRIAGFRKDGRGYLVVIVLGVVNQANDVYVLPCAPSAGFGEFDLAIGKLPFMYTFGAPLYEYAIRNRDVIPITGLVCEFDGPPDDLFAPPGWSSENPEENGEKDENKVRFSGGEGELLPGQNLRFGIRLGKAKLKRISTLYRDAYGVEKVGYTREF